MLHSLSIDVPYPAIQVPLTCLAFQALFVPGGAGSFDHVSVNEFAWKLKRAGYHVNGIYFHFWKWNTSENEYGRDSDRLNDLAEKIGVDLVEMDAQEIFKAKVISPMVEMIEKGLTPNPCIFCNPELKFSLLINYADQMGITHIATGHYVISREKKDNQIGLFKAEDKAKDQSYFLCKLDQEILKRVIFPLGYTNKKENIILATRLGLPIEKIYESQDLCFLSNGKINLTSNK